MGSPQQVRPSGGIVRFDSFEVDLHSGELRKHGIKLKLPEQSFQVLQALLERPGEVVMRTELQQRIWPADTFVDFDHGLNNVINRLREVVGDSAESPRYIDTVARRGYRFIGTPERIEPTAEEKAKIPLVGAEQAAYAPRGRKWATGWRIAALVATALVVIVGANFGKLRDRISRNIGQQHIQSLAVLPLTNLSGDPAQEYFADGLTDALIGDLSQIREVKVISRTSSMRYKQTKKSLPEIARELDVDGVIEGTVQRSDGRVRITAQLIQGATDKHIWAGSFDRSLSDALTLQGEIARSIAQEIRVQLTPQERQRMTHTPAVNLRALEAYLQGEYHYQKAKDMAFHRGIKKQHQADLDAAIGFYQDAVREDPRYARAYLGMGEIWGVPASVPYPPFGLQQSAREAIHKALAIEPDMAEAYVALARIDLRAWKFAAVEQEAKRAVRLNPNLAATHNVYWAYLCAMGRMDEAMEEAERVQALNPSSDAVAWVFYVERHFDRFIELKRNDIARHAFGPMAHYDLGYGYGLAHMYKEAVEEWEEAMTEFGYDDLAEDLRRGYAANGFKAAMREWAAGWERPANREGIPPDHLAFIYAFAGEKDRAFGLLEKAIEEHSLAPPFFKTDPTLDDLRSDPRFDQLLRRIGFPQ